MHHAMITTWSTLLDVALRTSVVYLALLGGFRLTGKRQLGQLSVFDLVLLLVIANAVQNAMVGPDTSVAGGLVAATVLLLWHRVIGYLRRRSAGVARLLGSSPTVLINEGRVLTAVVAREGFTEDELLQALREHGVASPTDVRLAVLEPDGMISVIQNDDIRPGARPHHRIRMARRQ
jgi:uncharacterized membrane protein YcaP (DUF421 family)